MKRFSNWLGQRSPVRPMRARSPRKPSLNLEVLEDRCVLSVIGSMVDHGGLAHLYAIDAQSHQVEEFQPRADHFIGGNDIIRVSLDGPQVDEVTAGLDDQGRAVVYARTRDTSTPRAVQVRESNGSWFTMGNAGGEGVTEISGSPHAAVFSIGASGNVFVNVWNGTPTTHWQSLGSPNNARVSRISVGTGLSGKDEVFAIGAGQAIFAYDTGDTRGWQLVDNSASFIDISATQNGEVYAIDSGGTLHHDMVVFQHGLTRYPAGFLVGAFGSWAFYPIAVTLVWSDTAMAEFFLTDGTLAHFRTLSVGKLANGQDVVYAVDTHGNAVKYLPGQAPRQFAQNIEQVSGTDLGWYLAITGPYMTRSPYGPGRYFSSTALFGNLDMSTAFELWETQGDGSIATL
jgi:hypothetical protein